MPPGRRIKIRCMSALPIAQAAHDPDDNRSATLTCLTGATHTKDIAAGASARRAM
jgi:hypothetical protein